MTPILPRQEFVVGYTPWHITFGTYGTRLHGSTAPTVDKSHNEFGQPFLPKDQVRVACERERMKFPPRYLTDEQRVFVEASLKAICDRGGWQYRTCAAQSDHVHALCDVRREIHGEKVRRLMKRWLGQSLSDNWPMPSGATWWAEEGSNIAIHDEQYLNNCLAYIFRQRTTPQRAGATPAPDSRRRVIACTTPLPAFCSGPWTARLARDAKNIKAAMGTVRLLGTVRSRLAIYDQTAEEGRLVTSFRLLERELQGQRLARLA